MLGAGVGADSQLPTWKPLMTRVLESVAEGWQFTESQRSDFARAVLERESFIGAGTVIRSLTRDHATLASMLGQALYGHSSAALPLGTLVRRIAALATALPGVEILTTNYDNLVEQALDLHLSSVQADPRRPKAMFAPRQRRGAFHIPVWHVHGFLPPTGARDIQATGQLVLGESDYYTQSGWASWRRNRFAAAVTRGTAVFIGAGLGDPNLVRFLLEEPPDPRGAQHFYIVAREPEPGADAATGQADFASLERIRSLGMAPVVPDYFGQVSQLLNEVVKWRDFLETSDKYTSYAEWPGNYEGRLKHYTKRFAEAAIPERGEAFRRVQETVRGRLMAAVHGLRESLQHDGGDMLEISVYARASRGGDDATRSLVEWASSRVAVTNRRSMSQFLIPRDGVQRPVRVFRDGRRQTWTTPESNHPTSFRRSAWALPIYLDEPPWQGLPVGVVMVSSTAERLISNPAQEHVEHVWKTLEDVGATLLDPDKLQAMLRSGG